MNGSLGKLSRCAIYTRKSTEHNLDLAFTSLDAQREAREAYITSQAGEGWRLLRDRYDDGAFSGASLERPALQRLLADVRARRVDIVVVYKVDRLTRSLADFAKLIELFEPHRVSFVSVTQSFNTSSSMGRLTLKGEHRSGAELDGLVHVIAGAWGVTLAQQAAAAKHECVHVVRIDLERLAGVRDHAVEIIAPAREDDGALQVRPEEVSALDPLGCDQPSAGFDFRRTDGVAEAFRLIVGPQGRRRGDGRDRQRCWLVGEEVEQSLVNVEAGHGCIVAAPDHTVEFDRRTNASCRPFELDLSLPL